MNEFLVSAIISTVPVKNLTQQALGIACSSSSLSYVQGSNSRPHQVLEIAHTVSLLGANLSKTRSVVVRQPAMLFN